jgi:hypothetical protein
MKDGGRVVVGGLYGEFGMLFDTMGRFLSLLRFILSLIVDSTQNEDQIVLLSYTDGWGKDMTALYMSTSKMLTTAQTIG